MEDDGGAKAPVTRLRRRLSVEQEESKSPTPSTPTKKRGRLAAKPQLDLIDENAIPQSPSKRTTRKSIARDFEPEEKLTPSRRSSRVRSNTSLVEAEEDKLTPGRRSSRIRSNTGLVEPAPAPDTPRAKRAARRTSLLGSDGETALTPTRARRARKDSTSSIDVQGSANGTPVTPARIRRGRTDTSNQDDDATSNPIIETIPEEHDAERKLLSSSQNSSTPSPNSVRKSLRLLKKKSPTSNDKNVVQNSVVSSQEQTNNVSESTELDQTDGNTVQTEAAPSNTNDELSISSANLINNLDKTYKKKANGVNKSTSAIDAKNRESKRHRTKSWTISVDQPGDDYFHSDNEKTKKKLREKQNLSSFEGLSSKLKHNKSNEISKVQVLEVSSESNSSKKKKRKSVGDSYIENPVQDSLLDKPGEKDKSLLGSVDTGKESNKEDTTNDTNALNNASNAVKRLFEKDPALSIQSLEFIEDSDTGDKDVKSEDQCVPVIHHHSSSIDQPQPFAIPSSEEEKPDDRSIEPMDIDETMPDNVSLTEYATNRSRNSSLSKSNNVENKLNDSLNKSKRKSSFTSNKDMEQSEKDGKNAESTLINSSNISKRKSSISNITTKDLEQPVNGSNNSILQSTNRSRNSSLSKSQNGDSELNDNLNKSKRKSSISNLTAKDLGQPGHDNDGSIRQTTNRSHNSSLSKSKNDSKLNENPNKSKRKSSISNSTKDLEQENENKSTLILTELNVSSETNSSKSSPISNEKSHEKLSVSKEIDINKSKSANNCFVVSDSITSSPLTNGHISEKAAKKLALSNCLTSTPVQDKDMKNTNLQINTSVIAPVNEMEIKKADKSASKAKDVPKPESSESESDSDEDLSKDRSCMIDDEAMDAGDDYQSGDSQDEEERQYEKDHEIIDKGDTLTSEDEDLSTNSEYEKDSFIVSSNEEDSELLSGSGDDLDMSDNELSMSKKSKDKYNNRKIKEQKKASREMFEARHQRKSEKGQDTSKDKKTSVRSRLDSTLLHSGDDNMVPPKKNKRMRLESETSFAKSDHNNSESNKDVTLEIGYKKKSKRLSESLCESVLNEKEVTMHDNSEKETDDPLSVAVKQEPKTPKKLEISTVHFTDREEMEQIVVANNVTIMENNETSDPLQTSLSENDDDDESISEHEEATLNYEGLLVNLNNEHKLQIKSHDTSLIVSQETKKNAEERIIEELNITATKNIKTKNTEINKKPEEPKNKLNEVDESSSDSMDLKLLISEDSNDGDKDSNHEKTVTVPEKIIPLKRCEGKTNIRESISTDEGTKCKDLNTSKIKKDKKRKLSTTEPDLVANQEDENSNEIKFFIDTVGTYGESTDCMDNLFNKNKDDVEYSMTDKNAMETSSTSIKSKKNKNKTLADSFMNDETVNTKSKKNKKFNESLIEDAIDNVSYSNSKDSKITEVSLLNEDTVDSVSISKKSKKKKNNKNDISLVDESTTTADTLVNLSSKKHKNKEADTSVLNVNTVENSSPITSSKKNKAKKVTLNKDTVDNTPLNSSMTFKKADRKESLKEAAPVTAVNGNEAEQSKTRKTVSHLDEVLDENNDNIIKIEISKKKRKRKSSCPTTEDVEAAENSSEVVLLEKSNKKLKLDGTDNVSTGETAIQEMTVDKQNKRRRKRNKNKLIDVTPEPQVDNGQGKKRKERDEDNSTNKKSKVIKINSSDKIHIPRLPDALLNKLEDKPNKEILESKKSLGSAVATTGFSVENAKRRKNKPSDFLEESVYLNDYESPVPKKTKQKIVTNKPKILPFIPVASTSDEGFTTNFQVRVLTGPMEFQAKPEAGFKTAYLQTNKKMKKRSSNIRKLKKSMSKF